MDPRNHTLDNGPALDPFEQSITQHQQRLDALRAVRAAQEHLEATQAAAARMVAGARKALADKVDAAGKLGAYDLLPENMRPKLAAVAGGAS